MTQHEEMKAFLESIRRPDNGMLIDAVENGYDACFESLKNLVLGAVPVAAAATLGGMYGTHTGPFAPEDNSKTIEQPTQQKQAAPPNTFNFDGKNYTLRDGKRVALDDATQKKVAKTAPIVHDTVHVPGKTVHDTVYVDHPAKTVHDTVYVNGEGNSLRDMAFNVMKGVSDKVNSWTTNTYDENTFHPTTYHEVDNIEGRISNDKKKLAKYGWNEVPFDKYPGKLTGYEVMNNTTFNYDTKLGNIERCAKKADVDINPAKSWMVSPSGYVAYNILSGAVFTTIPFDHQTYQVSKSSLASAPKFMEAEPDNVHDAGNNFNRALRLEDAIQHAN